MIERKAFSLIAVSIAVFLAASACKNKDLSSDASGNAAPASPSIQNSDPNSVSIKIHELSRQKVKEGEEVTWMAIHESSVGTARFQIRLIIGTPRGDSPFFISKGAFISEPGSQYSEFLRQVAKALEAKNIKPRKTKIRRLDFVVSVLGQNLSRGQGADVLAGGFTSAPRGDWLATKVFVGDDAAEFFLNLNSKEGRGELSIKDPGYGDAVMKEFSRVF
jgi:hypothetical protein